MVAKLPRAARPQQSLHDVMIGALIRPSWLVNASLLDNVWIIKSRKNDAEETIYFDAPITSWPHAECLTDDRFQQDLITVKLVLYFSMKPKPIGWATKGSTVVDIFQAHVDFVRWRTDRGVASNSELSAPWYNDFDRCFKLRAREGLLRLAERAVPVLEAVKERILKPERDDRGGIAGDPFARLIGMSKSSGMTVHARIMIERFFSKNGIRYTRTAESRKQPLQANEGVTNGNAYKYYRVWLDLWRLRDRLPHDIIGYKAFSSGRKLAKHVNRFFETATPTDDAPAYQTSYLINSSLKLLLDPVCDKILDLVEGGINTNREVIDKKLLLECNERLKHLGLPTMGTLYQIDRWRKSAKLTLHNMIFKVLPVAARVVSTAFSARRDAEIKTSPIDCIHIDQRGEIWLNCMIVKNVDQKDLVPIPKSVARAVEVVRRIRALGNKASQKLYDFACPFLKRAVKFDVRESLDMVRDYFGVPLLEDGTAWAFKPHQFRKFFAVTYFWRWAFPDLTALTFHLRHFNPDTTRGYIEMKAAEALRMRDEKLAAEHRNRDVERKKTFDDTKTAFVLSVVRGVADGEPLGGSMGRQIEARINALKDEFLSDIHVTEMEDDRPSFDQMLADLASTVSLEPHPEGFSLCGFGTGPETIRQHCSMSVCLRLREEMTGDASASASKQDYGFAEPLGCLKCGCRASLETMSEKWDAEIQNAEQALLDADDELAPFIRERIRMIEEYA